MSPGSPAQHKTDDPNPQDPPPPQNAGQPPLPPPPGHHQFPPQQVQPPVCQYQTPAGSPYVNFSPPPPPPQQPNIYQQQPNTAAPNNQQPVYAQGQPAYVQGQPAVYSNQPGAVQYVVQQQQVTALTGLFIGSQPWTTDLFDCMSDPNSALITCCLPCITVGQIAEILDNGNTTCATAGMIYGAIAFFTGFQYLYSCGYRTKLRAKFNLVDSPGPDVIIHCLCECCALSQEYRELVNRGLDPALGWNGVVAAQQQQQGAIGMAAPKQQMMMVG